MNELHDGIIGGHFGGETMTHNILRVSYCWPSLFKDAQAYATKWKAFQLATRKETNLAIPSQPVTIECPFQQWGFDIIGEISPNSSRHHKYILTANNYFTHWMEAVPLKKLNE